MPRTKTSQSNNFSLWEETEGMGVFTNNQLPNHNNQTITNDQITNNQTVTHG